MKQIDIHDEFNSTILKQDNPELNFQRMISVPSSAMGTLRKELIDTLGMERAKGFLHRYGWNCGVSDTLIIKEQKWDNKIDQLLAGPKMHTLTGHVQVEPLICEVDFEKKVIHFEGNWINSYEANEHLKLFGTSNYPVCHTLVGYASGCLSTIIGEKVYVKETKCIAMGDDHCHWICKTLEEWEDDVNIEVEQQLYEADNIGEELEETYEKLRIERDNLSKTYQVHSILVKELLYETGLKSIAEIFYQTINIPIIIEDNDFNPSAMGGLTTQEAVGYSNELKKWFKEQDNNKGQKQKEIKQTLFLDLTSDHKRLITPIYFRKKVYGYCSLIYHKETHNTVDSMVLEQTSLACSLQILNERTRFNTEQHMRGSFLEDILSQRITKPEIVKRAHYIDFQLIEPFFMVAINRKFEEASLKEEVEFNDQFMNDLLTFFKQKQINGLFGQKSGNIIILLSESTLLINNMKKENFCRLLLDYCEMRYPQDLLKLGISSSSPSIEEAPNLYDESLASLKVTNFHQNLVFFDSLGLVGMLLQTKDLATIKKFAYKVLGKLIAEDKNKDMELTKTLYYFLENGSNVHKTARSMNFSISGLRYRLGRLNEILQLDINTPYIRHEIYLALQSLIVLGELNID